MRALATRKICKTTQLWPNLIILYIFKEYIDKTLTFIIFNAIEFLMNEYTFVAVVVYVLISHNPKKFSIGQVWHV